MSNMLKQNEQNVKKLFIYCFLGNKLQKTQSALLLKLSYCDLGLRIVEYLTACDSLWRNKKTKYL